MGTSFQRCFRTTWALVPAVFLAVGMRAEERLYADSGLGVSWLSWEAMPFSPGVVSAPPARVASGEITVGWRLRPWLAAEISAGRTGTWQTTSHTGFTTLVGYAGPDLNSVVLFDGRARHRFETFAAGALASWPVGRGLTLFSRQQIVAFSHRQRTTMKTSTGLVYQLPNLPTVTYAQSTTHARSWCWRPSFGLAWQPARWPRVRFAAEVGHIASAEFSPLETALIENTSIGRIGLPPVSVTSLLARASYAF